MYVKVKLFSPLCYLLFFFSFRQQASNCAQKIFKDLRWRSHKTTEFRSEKNALPFHSTPHSKHNKKFWGFNLNIMKIMYSNLTSFKSLQIKMWLHEGIYSKCGIVVGDICYLTLLVDKDRHTTFKRWNSVIILHFKQENSSLFVGGYVLTYLRR